MNCTLAGSFASILTVALLLHQADSRCGFLSRHRVPHIVPLFFVGMAIYQAVKFYRKYYGSSTAEK